MDALKLFYEQQLDAQQRRERDRRNKAVGAVPLAAAKDRPAGAKAPQAAETEIVPQRESGIADAQRAGQTTDSAELLLRHVEQHAGQALRTRASIDAFFAATARSASDASPPNRSLLREASLVLFLAVAVLQYYYVEVSLEIASLNRVTVFVPVEPQSKPRPDKS